MNENTDWVYDGKGPDSPQWWPSRYGADDQLGAGNELTPERTLAALRLPKEGRMIELAHPLEPTVPAYPPRSFSQLVLAHGAMEETLLSKDGTQVSYFEEQVNQTYHIGTHIDGLAHIGIAGHFYNGNHYRDFYAPTGVTRLGAENIRPWVARGVLLDIAGLEDVEVLPEGFQVTPDHLERACRRQSVEVRAGDAVLLHTGWAGLWQVDNEKYGAVEPGATWAAAHWLTDRRVSLVGADNWAFEVLPFEDPVKAFAVHQHLVAEAGVYILENIKTAEIVASGASEFLFVLTPPKVKGATGAQAAPVAVV